jgi:hypothetical protein
MPSDRIGVDWQGEAVVALLEQTGRRPYLIQLACSKALDVLTHDQKARALGLVTVDLLHRSIGEIIHDAQSSDQYFGFLWDREAEPDPGEETVNGLGRMILWVLMQRYPHPLSRLEIIESIRAYFHKTGLKPIPFEFFDPTFKRQMILLHRIFDAITEQGGRYTIGIPLMQTWLRDRLQAFRDEDALVRLLHQGIWEDYEMWRHANMGEA